LLLSNTSVTALHVHGDEDGCIRVDMMNGSDKYFTAGVSLQRIAHAGHFVHLEKPDAVHPLWLDFFASPRT